MIDFHTHVFPEKIVDKTISFLENQCGGQAYLRGTAEALLSSMNEAGIGISVVLPVVTRPEQFDSINRFALSLTEITDGRLLSFGGIHPDNDHPKERIKELKANGIKGIKLHPDYQETRFDDIRYKRIVDAASELGLIVSVHAGLDPGYPDFVHCTPRMAAHVIEETAPEKLVLAHMGGFMRWNETEELLTGKNVYFDTAVCFGKIPKEQLLRMIQTHGAERILFATDSPWGDQKEFVSYLQSLPLDGETMKQISEENAKKLLGIS